MRQGSTVGSVEPLHGPGRQRSHANAGQPDRPEGEDQLGPTTSHLGPCRRRAFRRTFRRTRRTNQMCLLTRYAFGDAPGDSLLRQLCLPLRGAWALTSPGLPWAGPGDLATHHATDCTYPDSDPYATRAAVGHGTQPGSMGRQPAAGAMRHCSVRCACHRRPRDPTGLYGPSAGRGSYVTTHLGTAGSGTTRVPWAAGGLMELLVDAALPGRIRPY
jgi:hypothetical protein